MLVDPNVLRSLIPETPASVLRLLAAAEPGTGPPAVALHLASGHTLDGHLVTVGTDTGHEVVVLAMPPHGHLGYTLMSSITAVTVRASDRFQDLLTGGAVPLPVTGTPVSRLALRRDFAPTPELPLQLDWEALPDTEEALANLARLLTELRAAVEELRADELGRQAWSRIRELRLAHEPGTPLTVRPVPDGLLVRVDLLAALPRRLAGELREQLNTVL
jgi:hypothetical protein